MRLLLGSICLLLMMVDIPCAQDTVTCKVVMTNRPPLRTVVNGKKYYLFDSASVAGVTQQEVTIDSLKRDIAAKDKLILSLNTIPEKCTTAVAAKNEYIASLNELMLGYKQMYKDAMKLSNASVPWVTFEGAIGVSGAGGVKLTDMSKPVILAGIGIRRFRTYLMLQEKNVGIMVGGSFKLY